MKNSHNIPSSSVPNLSRRRFVQGSSALAMSAPLLAIPAWAQGGGSASSPSRQAPRRLANNPLGFNGVRQDPATGLYHLGQGYRVYNPALMRFQACDSMSPFGKGGINAYAYCLGDPVNLRDPSGHFAIASLLIGAAVGAAVGAATSAIGEGIRAGVNQTEFEWKQVAFGALLGGISGAFGAAAVGAKASVKAGLAVGDALVSSAADFGLSVATGSDAKQAAISAGIGAVVGLVSFGTGIGAGKAGEYLSTLDKRLANIQRRGLDGGAGRGFLRHSPLLAPGAPRPLSPNQLAVDEVRRSLMATHSTLTSLNSPGSTLSGSGPLQVLLNICSFLLNYVDDVGTWLADGVPLQRILRRAPILDRGLDTYSFEFEHFIANRPGVWNIANVANAPYGILADIYSIGDEVNDLRNAVYFMYFRAGLPTRAPSASFLQRNIARGPGSYLYFTP